MRDVFDLLFRSVDSSRLMQVLRPELVEGMRTFLPNVPMTVIGNSADVFHDPADLSPHRVVWLARLVPIKRLNLPIDAFSGLADRFTDWSLEIRGQDFEL